LTTNTQDCILLLTMTQYRMMRMNITLRKANALQAGLKEALNQLPITTDVVINEFQDWKKEVDRASQKLKTGIAARHKLVNAMYEIRKKVSTANTKSGIDDLLADIAMLENLIRFEESISRCDIALDPAVIEGKLAKIKNAADSDRNFYGNDEVSMSVLQDIDLQHFAKKVATYKKDRASLKDKLLELNVGTKIELSAETETVLKEHNLI
jgi:hypothetical protein